MRAAQGSFKAPGPVSRRAKRGSHAMRPAHRVMGCATPDSSRDGRRSYNRSCSTSDRCRENNSRRFSIISTWWLGMPFEVFAIVRKLCQLIGLDGVQGVGEGHVAEAVVMAVTFTVRSDMDELGPVAPIVERADEPIGQMLTAGEQSFKGDGASDRSVIKRGQSFAPKATVVRRPGSDRCESR